MSQSPTELDVLLSSLTAAVSVLQESLTEQNMPPLRSDDPAPHPIDLGLPDPTTWYARKAIVGLCNQITALVQNPIDRSAVDGFIFHRSAALTVACDGQPSPAEVVDAAGPDGVEIAEIAAKTGKNRLKLRTIFRQLTTTGYFKEVSFDRITRTRSTFALLSSGPGSMPFFGDLVCQTMPAAALFRESIKSEPVMGDPTPFERFNKKSFYDWVFSQPRYISDFHKAMVAIERHLDRGILSDYPWEELGPAITLVDVGGGNGALSLELLRRFTGWRAIIQDRPEVVSGAKEFWSTRAPEFVQTGRVDFLGHDFLQPTPLRHDPNRAPYVFMTKSILHNWTDDTCVKIIENLSPAATTGSTLLIINFTPAAPDESSPSVSVREYLSSIVGKSMKEIQAMSLPTPSELGLGWGSSDACVTGFDGVMLALFHSRDRTKNDLQELLETTSWSFKGLTRTRGLSSIIRLEKL